MSLTNIKARTSSTSSSIQFCFTIFLATQVVLSVETNTFDQNQGHKPNLGLTNPSSSFEKMNFTTCANKCSLQSQCRSFTWDSLGESCTIDSWPKANVDNMIPSGSKKPLTAPSKCRFDLQFELRPYGTEEKCVYVSSDQKNYYASRKWCLQHGGRLFKSNSKGLISLITTKAKGTRTTDSIWVGLDDIDSEDRFIWSDGEPMTALERSEFFFDNQPDDGYKGQDCVQLMVEYKDRKKPHVIFSGKFIDIECHKKRQFACEII